jgi:hypothetical protein
MAVTPPQPGFVKQAEMALILNVLRANLALVNHVLDQRQDEALAGAAADLRSAIGRLDARANAPADPPDLG